MIKEEEKIVKRILSLLLVLSILSLGVTGCSKGNDPAPVAGDVKKDTVITVLPGDLTTLDASKMSNKYQLLVFLQMFDGLTRVDNQFKLHPGLAKKWDISEDGKEYTFYLEEGVKFHNGDIFKASDVKFTVEMYTTHPEEASVFYMVDHAEVVDDYTAKIVLKYPYGSFTSLLATMMMIPEEYYKEVGEQAFGRHPIGTGPYVFESWSEGQSIVFSAFKDYYKGEASIKNIVFRIITDSNAATVALETGDVDFLTGLSEMNLNKVKNSDKLSYLEGQSIFYCYFPINCMKVPDKRVRQAICYAANTADINTVAADGAGTVTGLPVIEGSQGYTTDYPKYETNIAKAKELLKEAGYENGLNLKMTYLVGEVGKKRSETLQAQLAQAGINLEVIPMELGAFYAAGRRGDHDITVTTLMMVPNNIDYSYNMIFASEGQFNLCMYHNPEFDKMLDDARREMDTAKAEKMYQDITRYILDDAVMIPAYFDKATIGYNKNLKGVKLHPRELYEFYNYSF